jgi:hypothetical protein
VVQCGRDPGVPRGAGRGSEQQLGGEPDHCLAVTATPVPLGQGRDGERPGTTDTRAFHQRRGEVGPADQRTRRQPRPSPWPAADVGRVEQVLAQPRRPVGQDQRARRRVQQFQCARRPREKSQRVQYPCPEVGRGEEGPRPQDRRNAPADVQLVRPQPFGQRRHRRSIDRAFAEEGPAQPRRQADRHGRLLQ